MNAVDWTISDIFTSGIDQILKYKFTDEGGYWDVAVANVDGNPEYVKI
jgi:hypothetical protein